MKISGLFYSIQGEGKLVGTPSVFIRTSGCNLRCTWCDTPYTSWTPEGEELSIDEIRKRVRTFRCRHVVLTGGEPLIADGVEQLTHNLLADGFHLTIETAATIWKDVAFDLASISPKLSNSTPWHREAGRFASAHDEHRINLDVIRQFMSPRRLRSHNGHAPQSDYQLKFVVDQPADVDEIEGLLEAIGPVDRTNVLLMPQGTTREELDSKQQWIADLCKKRGFRYCPRLHIALFGNVRST